MPSFLRKDLSPTDHQGSSQKPDSGECWGWRWIQVDGSCSGHEMNQRIVQVLKTPRVSSEQHLGLSLVTGASGLGRNVFEMLREAW